jgi:chemotaxis methyl-accepting protein methylase
MAVEVSSRNQPDDDAAARAGARAAWDTDVRIRIRPGRADSGVKLYVTDHTRDGPRELMANTRFFRYPQLFDRLVDLLMENSPRRPIRVCITPLSVGLEAVSLVIAGLRKGLFSGREVGVEGFDLSAKATELARGSIYPRLFFPDDLSALHEYLTVETDGYVSVRDAVSRHIRVLPAADALIEQDTEPYDLVICLNLLMHLAEPDRPRLVERLAGMTAPGGILCLNNNQEWPQELAPYHDKLTGAGFVSLHKEFATTGSAPDFAVTDARAMILRRVR